MPALVTKKDVYRAAENLAAKQSVFAVTTRAVYKEIGKVGSLTTIHRHLQEWRRNYLNNAVVLGDADTALLARMCQEMKLSKQEVLRRLLLTAARDLYQRKSGAAGQTTTQLTAGGDFHGGDNAPAPKDDAADDENTKRLTSDPQPAAVQQSGRRPRWQKIRDSYRSGKL